mmetsp:Transcript_48639/g.72182  ORF Transcript_48639/g.72182 Transcript_48639/m.72182 type:complete len:372 (+) Transcript_48639:186-1301(+)|eukprot:CAMPEP_0195519964 /NCGR_PEP_ID=MMETSP0794_2-20130614/15842_1 /TAXON_ID=515487 /ORGANISM="Stephanopyxis turris, Strain CCMP 815" /LENGTH=371 /DNA_ID=CAMNT_0040649217 /DNA_START=180 /DNA_END=1295 /DNA_ORIENTATION=-
MAWIESIFSLISRSKSKEQQDPPSIRKTIELNRSQSTVQKLLHRHSKAPQELKKAAPKRDVIIHHPPWKVPAINDPFPNLVGTTQLSNDFNLYEHKGNSWAMIFTHPLDFTPVCTSEFTELLKLKHQFNENGIKIVGFSTNDATTHRNWINDVEAHVGGYNVEMKTDSCGAIISCNNVGGSCNRNPKIDAKVDFPIYSDPTLEMAVELGVLEEDVKDIDGLPVTARSVYVLNPAHRIMLITTYPTTLGRNWREILRAIIALKLVESNNATVHIPSHWEPGDRVLIDPQFDDVKCDEVFGKENWERVMLPSEVEQEIASFSNGDGGVKIKKRNSFLKKKQSIDEEKERSDPVTLPKHYMRLTNRPDNVKLGD